MFTLLASFGIGCLAYGLVALTFDPFAATVPALLATTIALFLLLRRVSRQVQVVSAPLEGMLRAGNVEEADALLKSVADRFGPWMPMLAGQMNGQRGMLKYMRMDWDDALPLLDKGKWRNWMVQTCIACVHHRKGDKDKAYELLAKATKAGKREPMAWIVRAVVLYRDGKKDLALQAISDGVAALPDNR